MGVPQAHMPFGALSFGIPILRHSHISSHTVADSDQGVAIVSCSKHLKMLQDYCWFDA